MSPGSPINPPTTLIPIPPTTIPLCTITTTTASHTSFSVSSAFRQLAPSPLVPHPAYPLFVSCSLGVIFGLKALSLIIVAIVYYKRQKKRKVCLIALSPVSQLI